MAIDTKPSGRLAYYGTAKKVMLGLLGLAALLQIVGFCTPAWVVTNFPYGGKQLKEERGLWYFINCINKDCDTGPITDIDDHLHIKLQEHGLLEYQIEATLALFAVLVAFTLLSLAMCRPGQSHLTKLLLILGMMVTTLVSSAMAILAASRLADVTQSEHDRLGRISPYLFPWSALLTGLGGILCFIVFLIYIFILLCCRPVRSKAQYIEKNGRHVINGPPYPYTVHPGQEKVIVTDNRHFHSEFVQPAPKEKIIIRESVQHRPHHLGEHHDYQRHVVAAPVTHDYHQYERYEQSMSAPHRHVEQREQYDYDSEPAPIHVKMLVMGEDGTFSDKVSTHSSYRRY